jgi:hypothetical protein
VPWRLTLRVGPKVRRDEFASLDEAIDGLRAQLSAAPRRDTVDLRVRTFEPIQQVSARGELAGPRRARGGVDVRGDGSAEAFTGKLRRRVVEQEPGEDAFSALRRVLAERG